MKEKTPKQPKNGLTVERGLRVVKSAGYKAKTAKKDKTVNKRAGLHDKKKNLSVGETRVYKRQPLGLTRVRRMRQAVVALAAVIILVVAYFGMGFIFKPNFIFVEDLGNNTVCAVKAGDSSATADGNGKIYYFPEDGSLPTEHTLIENVAYMNYVLKNQPYWSSYMHSHVSTVMDQDVYTHKKTYDGKTISADMPQGASNIARQFCYTDTEVKWREKDKNKVFDDMDNVDWSDSKPYGLLISDFRKYRGLPANDFSAYILDELTVKNANAYTVEDNGDGTYSMTLELRVHQSGLDSAVHYYKQQMYVTGGLYAWPTFDYTYVTYTFTKDWVIKSFTIRDSYTAKMGTILSSCTSESVTDFSYRLEDAQNSYYDDYFYQDYITWNPTSVSTTPDAAACLASAFGSVLEEGANFKIDMELDGKPVDGSVYFTLNGGSLDDLRVTLGNISVYIDGQNGKSAIYAALGNNKFKIGAEALFGSLNDGTATPAEGAESILDLNSLVGQLFEGEFEITRTSKNKKNYYATLKSELTLFGLNIPVEFAFDIKSEDITLDYVRTEFDLGKTHLKANLTFGTEEDIPAKLTAAQKADYIDILNEGIALDASLKIDSFAMDGTLFLALNDGVFGGVSAKFGDMTAYYQTDGMLYFADGSGAKYKLNTGDISLSGEQGVTGIFENFDISAVIAEVISNLSLGGGKLSTNATLNLLEPAIKLALAVNINDGFRVDFNAELFGKQVEVAVKLAENSVPELKDKDGYVDILNDGISFDLTLSIDNLNVAGTVFIGLDNGKFKDVRVQFGTINAFFAEDTLYFADGSGAKYKVNISSLTGSASVSAFNDIDFKEIISDIIKNISFSENSIILENFAITEDVVLNLAFGFEGGINASVRAALFGKEVSVGVKPGKTSIPELEDKENYVDLMNEGVCLDFGLQIDGVDFGGSIFVEMQDGKFAGVRVNVKNSDIAVWYESGDNALYISGGDDLNVKLPLSAFGTATVEAGQGFDVKELFNQIIENLTAAGDGISTNFKINFTLGGENVEIPVYIGVKANDGIKINANISAFGKYAAADVSFGSIKDAPALEESKKAKFIDVLNDGFSVSGAMQLNAGGTDIQFIVNKLSMSFNGGVSFALDANLIYGGMYNNIYASYNAATGNLTITYGAPNDNGIGAMGLTLNVFNDDLNDIQEALVAVYNKVIEVINGVLEDKTLAAADNLQDVISQLEKLLSSLNKGSSAVTGIADLFGGDNGFNISNILKSISIKSVDGGTSITYGNSLAILLGLKDSKIDLGVEYTNGNSSILFYANALSFGAYEYIECPVEQDKLINAGQMCDAIDYIAATLDMFTEQSLSLEVTGNIETNSGDTKYEVSANLEYDRGAKDGMPIHVALGKKEEGENRKGLNFWINSDVYAHLNITLASKMANVDSLLVDLYLLDIVPQSSNGKITGIQYNDDGTPSTDGTLDLFFKISKYAPDESGYQPLAAYAPVSELTNLSAMAAAILNLGGVSFDGEEYQEINDIIAEISNALDCLLISNLDLGVGVQLASLGESLLPNILGKTVQQIIGEMLGISKTEAGTNAPQKAPQAVREGNYVKYLALNREKVGGVDTSNVKIIFNSSAIYGGNVRSDIEFTANKTYNENGVSRLRNWGMHNVYINGSLTEMLSLDMAAQYSVTKNFEELSDYYDFRGVDVLLQAIVNSATHESARATEKELEYYGDDLPDYILNHYYYVNGRVSATLNLLDWIKPTVAIDIVAISVTIDEQTNDVAINVKLHYDGLTASAIGNNVIVIDGESDVDLTIKGGMLYIRRTQYSYYEKKSGSILSGILKLIGYDVEIAKSSSTTKFEIPEVTYRVMPLSAMGGSTEDIIDLVAYALNLNYKLVNIINSSIAGSSSGGSGVSYDSYDYGKLVGTYFSYLTFSDDDNGYVSWEIALNGQFITDLLGMPTSNIAIVIGADYTVDGDGNRSYVVNDLTLKELTIKFLDSVNISMSVSGSFEYCNPRLIMKDGVKDVTTDVTALAIDGLGGLNWSEILGGTSIEEIKSHTAWNRLLAENGGKYCLEYSKGSKLKVGTLNFEHENLDGSYDSFGVEDMLVLFNGDTGVVYTLHDTPSLEKMPQKEGYAAVWENAYRLSGNGVILRAVYGNVYDITVNYGYEVNGETQQIYRNVYQQILLPKDVMIESDGRYYGLTGYTCTDDNGNKFTVNSENCGTAYNSEGQLCYLLEGVSGNYTCDAEWAEMYAVTFESTFGDSTVTSVKYYYEGTELNGNNLPEVPLHTGYNGAWMIEDGTKVTQNFTVYASYQINEYEVKIFSSQQVKDGAYAVVNGIKVPLEWISVDGGYEAVLALTHGSEVGLYTDIACADGTYNFSKYQRVGDGAFAAVESFTATAEDTYEIVWESKTVNLKYMSDVQFEGSAPDGEYFIGSVSVRYGKGEQLKTPVATDSSLTLIGWFVSLEDGSYSYVTSIDQAAKLVASGSGDTIEVTVWAVWAKNIEVTVTSASYSWFTLKVGGSYAGGELATEKSLQIAEKIGLTYSAKVQLASSSDGISVKEKWDGSFKNSNVFDLSHTGTGINYGGAIVTVTYTVGDEQIATRSGSAYKKV